jgi:hypothetical protein
MNWAWVQLMLLLIFTEISGTYTTECGALTLASIMNYRYRLTTRLRTADGCSHSVVKTHTLETINSNQKLDYQFSVPVDISVSNPILYTYLLTELSPSWGTVNWAPIQELPSISWNLKVQHRIHKSPPLVPILNHIKMDLREIGWDGVDWIDIV